MPSIFITGNSRGLGLALTRHYLEHDGTVYSSSRSDCPVQSPRLHHHACDLACHNEIAPTLSRLLPERLDLVVLNAGILGEIKDLADTRQDEIDSIMNINVWSNKVIIDWLIKHHIQVSQLVLMSSGASVNGNRGWGGYSLSKATLNMLARLYAHEMPDTHITAFAPGIIHTQMQDYLCQAVDTDKYRSISSLVNAYNTDAMPDPDHAAPKIAAAFEQCRRFDSGSFVDIRQL